MAPSQHGIPLITTIQAEIGPSTVTRLFREALGAPEDATVQFDCEDGVFRGATVQWRVEPDA